MQWDGIGIATPGGREAGTPGQLGTGGHFRGGACTLRGRRRLPSGRASGSPPWVLSSAGRASPLQGECRGFDPLSTHQFNRAISASRKRLSLFCGRFAGRSERLAKRRSGSPRTEPAQVESRIRKATVEARASLLPVGWTICIRCSSTPRSESRSARDSRETARPCSRLRAGRQLRDAVVRRHVAGLVALGWLSIAQRALGLLHPVRGLEDSVESTSNSRLARFRAALKR